MLSSFGGGLIQASMGLAGGRFVDEPLRGETEGAVEGFLPGGVDGVGLVIMDLIRVIRPTPAWWWSRLYQVKKFPQKTFASWMRSGWNRSAWGIAADISWS